MQRWARPCVLLVGMMALLMAVAPAWADDAKTAQEIVQKATATVEQFQKDPNMDGFRDLAKKAKGMLILPGMYRAAFLIGASGGSGVMVARGESPTEWRGPAFYTLGGASFGFQAGADAAEVIILAMTDRGVSKLLSPQVKLGADISVAAGPAGGGAAAGTAGLSADLVSYSVAKGLYGGFSVDGAVVGVRSSLNQAYYGKEVSPTDILMKPGLKNAQANALIEKVAQIAR